MRCSKSVVGELFVDNLFGTWCSPREASVLGASVTPIGDERFKFIQDLLEHHVTAIEHDLSLQAFWPSRCFRVSGLEKGFLCVRRLFSLCAMSPDIKVSDVAPHRND